MRAWAGVHGGGVQPSSDDAVGRELRIHAESLTPLRGRLCDGGEAVDFSGWLQLLAWLEDRLGAAAVSDERSGNDGVQDGRRGAL